MSIRANKSATSTISKSSPTMTLPKHGCRKTIRKVSCLSMRFWSEPHRSSGAGGRDRVVKIVKKIFSCGWLCKSPATQDSSSVGSRIARKPPRRMRSRRLRVSVPASTQKAGSQEGPPSESELTRNHGLWSRPGSRMRLRLCGMPQKESTMAFSQATKDAAYRRAGGKCECTMTTCSKHRSGSRCNADLIPGVACSPPAFAGCGRRR